MTNQITNERVPTKDEYGGSRQPMRYDKFRDIKELINFMNTQCGNGAESCCRKLDCPHYRNLETSRNSGMLIKHWSPDVFIRDNQEVPYCSIRNQPVEDKENS